MRLQCIKSSPSAMRVEDRKALERFSDLYDKSEVSRPGTWDPFSAGLVLW